MSTSGSGDRRRIQRATGSDESAAAGYPRLVVLPEAERQPPLGSELLRLHARRQESIARLGLRAIGVDDLTVLFREAVETAAAMLAPAAVTLLELDASGALQQRASAEIATGVQAQSRQTDEAAARVARMAVAQGRSVIAGNDYDIVGDVAALPPAASDVIALAVVVQGIEQVLGALCVNYPQLAEVTGEDIHFLQSAANLLGAAIARCRADAALRMSEARFRGTFEDAAIPMGLATLDGCFVRLNAPYCDLLGYLEHELIGRRCVDLVHPDDAALALASCSDVIEGQVDAKQIEWRFLHRGGGVVWGLVSLSVIEDAAGAPQYVLAQVQDVTERRAADAELRRREREFRALAENAPDLIARYDRELRHLYLNPAVERLFGYADVAARGRTHAELGVSAEGVLFWESHLREAFTGRREVVAEFEHPDRKRARTLLARMTPELDDSGAVTSVLMIARDITEQRALTERLHHLALHDAMTGLANRALLLDRLGNALDASQRRSTSVALLFLDLDNFKEINDTLGHSAGDQLLVQVARRLESCVRVEDTVARFGGDEFALLLPDVVDPGAAEEVADRVLEVLSPVMPVGLADVMVTASIGIVLGSAPESTPEDLLRWADIAMYRAKAGGRNRVHVFDIALQAEALGRLQRERDLRAATERNEFELRYLPTVSLKSGEVDGVEALVRWRHPQRGVIPPEEFIALAEETSLILPLGRWGLSAACRQLATWRASLPGAAGWSMAINLSPRQFRDPGLLYAVEAVLEDYELAGDRLILEIPEIAIFESLEQSERILGALAARGVRIAIDDFGTSPTAIPTLRRLPIHILKIDRSLIGPIVADPAAAGVVRALATLGDALGMRVVAEGVEDERQLELLRAAGVHDVQGFVIAQPLAVAEVPGFLSSRAAATSAEAMLD